MKLFKRYLVFLLICTQVFAINSFVNAETSFTINEPIINSNKMEFDITYNFTANYEQEVVVKEVDVVLCLDRSNSMLEKDDDGNLVVQTVWNAANTFVEDFYNKYPEGNLAIMSFGSNATKKENYKYCTNKTDALDEIIDIYSYTEHSVRYFDWWHFEWKNYEYYEWDNWNENDGATNIKAGFDYAIKIIEHKNKTNGNGNGNGKGNGKGNGNGKEHINPSSSDAIILFTDGVATRGGNRRDIDLNEPHSHNSNTYAAINAGLEAQEIANVITVGYFEGINNSYTKQVAQDTLDKAQNGGFFEATNINEVSKVFKDVVEELEFIGTDTIFSQIIKPEFEVVEDSVNPTTYTIETNEAGQTVLSWQLGNLKPQDYSISYKVSVKDGSIAGQFGVPVNENVKLNYNDLEGNSLYEDFSPALVDIVDNSLPIIVLTPEKKTFATSIKVNVELKSTVAKIVDYKCLKGSHTIEDFATGGFDFDGPTNDTDEYNIFTSFTVYTENASIDTNFKGNGIYTVYVKDELGNEVVSQIRIFNVFNTTDYTLPDNT